MKKIIMLLLITLLIPVITYAKLNEINLIEEKSISGVPYQLKDKKLFIDYDKRKIKIADKTGNIEKEITTKEKFSTPTFPEEGYPIVIQKTESNEINILDQDLNITGTINLDQDSLFQIEATKEFILISDIYSNKISTYDLNGIKIIDGIKYGMAGSQFYEKILNITNEFIYMKYKNIDGLTCLNKISNGNNEDKSICLNSNINSDERYFFGDHNSFVITDTKNNAIEAILLDEEAPNNKKRINGIYETNFIDGMVYVFTLNEQSKFVDFKNPTEYEKENIKVTKYDDTLTKIEDISYKEYLELKKSKEYKPKEPIPQKLFKPITNKIKEINPSIIYYKAFIEYKNEYYIIGGNDNTSDNLYQISKDMKEIKEYPLAQKEMPSISPYIEMRGIEFKTSENNLHIISELGSPLGRINSNKYPNSYMDTTIYQTYNVKYGYPIRTEIEGKGNIEVAKESKSNEIVKIKVTPEKGYVLKDIYIIDSNGNKQKLKEPSFIMPDNDVTIKAIFEIENPETSTAFPFIIILATSLIGILCLIIELNKTKRYIVKL